MCSRKRKIYTQASGVWGGNGQNGRGFSGSILDACNFFVFTQAHASAWVHYQAASQWPKLITILAVGVAAPSF